MIASASCFHSAEKFTLFFIPLFLKGADSVKQDMSDIFLGKQREGLAAAITGKKLHRIHVRAKARVLTGDVICHNKVKVLVLELLDRMLTHVMRLSSKSDQNSFSLFCPPLSKDINGSFKIKGKPCAALFYLSI